MISGMVCYPLPTICLQVAGGCNSASLLIKYQEAYMAAYSQVKSDVSCLLRVILEV